MNDLGEYIPDTLFLWTLWGLALICLLVICCRHVIRVYKSRWYDPSPNGPNKEVTWKEIKELCDRDPMCVRETWRRPWRYILRDIIFATLIVGSFIGLAKWIWECGALLTYEQAEQIAVIAGGSGIFLSAFGLFYNGRISTRAANRQAWINELRNEINDVISGMPDCDFGEEDQVAARQELNERHAKIELYLNPSERVHRTFMTLVRFMYGHHDIEVDKKIREVLELPAEVPTNDAEWKRRKSQIIRLANVLLKREWEQVKLIA